MLPRRSQNAPPSRTLPAFSISLPNGFMMSVCGRLAAVPVVPLGLGQELPGVLRLRRVVALARDERALEAAGVPVQVFVEAVELQPIDMLHDAKRVAPAAIAFLQRLDTCRECRASARRRPPATTSTGSPPRPRPSGSPTGRTSSRTSGTGRTFLISIIVAMVLSISSLRHVALVAVLDVAARLQRHRDVDDADRRLVLQRRLALELGAEQVGPAR